MRTAPNVATVGELIASQEDQPGTSKSTRHIAKELTISRSSVRRIAKVDLHLSAYRRIPAQMLSDATKRKRLDRSKKLLRRFKVRNLKRIFFTDEKNFFLNPPVNRQNNRVWATGRKADIDTRRLLIEREKFAPHLMVSAGVCFGGKGRLLFVDEKAKVNTNYYMTNLLPYLVADCKNLLNNNFTFQQDGAPAHTAAMTQEWIGQHCPDMIKNDEWPPNSPDLNPLDYHVWGAMLERYQVYSPKPKNLTELKNVLETIWTNLPQDPIDRAILAFRKRLNACVKVKGSHFEHFI